MSDSGVPIRTPDQHVRVFVSSTLQELADERAVVREAILQLHLAPVMFELGARPHPPRDLYRAYLDQSHIFLGIYWQKYGWVAPGETISGLEDEYRLSSDKPKLIYVKSPAPDREPRLKELLARIRSDDTVSYKSFATAAELRELIENDLMVLLTERFESPDRSLPSGTVTFLFTDIEGSAELAQQYPEALPALLARHHAILHQAIGAHHGVVFQITGDAFCAAFFTASDALQAALDAQRSLQHAAWQPAPVKVRMGLHTGAAQAGASEDRAGGYDGYLTLTRAQRVMSAAHGGQVLLSNPTAELLLGQLPAGVSLRDMQAQRLKGLSQPEHLWQLVAADLATEFPALKSLAALPNNLPVQLTPFIGRETELASITALFSDVHNRLVTIVAPGGMGKTRLALEAAGQLVQAFPQGVYFVALDRITSADLIVQTVAEVLPISLASQEDPKSRILDYLRNKAILLVMDNFEHVLDGAALVQDILAAAPRLQILATSRAKLNLMSETILTIDGLTVDEADPAKNSAIQLFSQHARRTQPKFELTAALLPAVTRICRMVDGMPLAIVLAAAWIDTLSVEEIAAEIEKSIDLLETELRDVSDRQRSVRAVIESSWNQVDAGARNLLKRLAVFRGGFTRAAAQAAAGASLRGLSQLVDKALLRRNPHTGRYSIHELLRQYAQEQLAASADEERSAHEAHAQYFADFMQTCGVQMHDHRQKEVLLEIEADIDNIRAAWNYWADKQEARRLLEFVEAMWAFFEVRGAFTPAIQFFADATNKLVATEPDIACARAQLRARQAWFTALIGLPDEGLQMAQESVTILRQYNQDISIGTFEGVCINAIFLNKIEIVSQISHDMQERAERSGDLWERGWVLSWIAYALSLKQQIGEAIHAGQESLATFEKLHNPFGAAIAAGLVLGAFSLATRDFSTAKTYLLRAVQAAEEINYLRMLQISYANLGTVALLESDVEQAQHFFLNGLRISQECGQTREMLGSLRDLANVYIAQGDLDSALKLLAVVLNHPASEQNSLNRPEPLRDEAEKLRVQIETRLDRPRYRSAWEAGQKKRLAEVVAQILA